MIEFEITPEMYREAWAKSRDMGKLKKSITNGDGNIAGFLGEIIARKFWDAKVDNTLDHDIILPNGLTVDIKTKRTKVAPLPEYECSVAAQNTIQKCDIYAFVRVEQINNEYTRGWYLGHMLKADYLKYARYLKKGQRDGDNWFTVKANCYNMKINELDLDKEKYLTLSIKDGEENDEE